MPTPVMLHKKQLTAMLGPVQGLTVLDYGCGTGDFIEILLNQSGTPKYIYAVDSNSEMIGRVSSRFDREIKNGTVIAEVITDPKMLEGKQFDRIICHNVLECIYEKLTFINCFNDLLAEKGIFLLSHHDFDSAIFNSHYKVLTRALVHTFADTQQIWQAHCDGQMGRKIPGLVVHSVFKDTAKVQTIRIVETKFESDQYGYLMADMILSGVKSQFKKKYFESWYQDLKKQSENHEYYFAIDLVVAILGQVEETLSDKYLN